MDAFQWAMRAFASNEGEWSNVEGRIQSFAKQKGLGRGTRMQKILLMLAKYDYFGQPQFWEDEGREDQIWQQARWFRKQLDQGLFKMEFKRNLDLYDAGLIPDFIDIVAAYESSLLD